MSQTFKTVKLKLVSENNEKTTKIENESKCKRCIHYGVCINPKPCKQYSDRARWLHSPFDIEQEVYEVSKRPVEKTKRINGKRYRYDDWEWTIYKYKWGWVETSCYDEKRLGRVFDNIEDARICRDELIKENKDD